MTVRIDRPLAAPYHRPMAVPRTRAARALTRITLVHKNCGHNCNICAYGPLAPLDYAQVTRIVDQLLRQGFRVHLYDFEITAASLAVFRRTRQFELPNPGWMNVTADFAPEADDLAYVNGLGTAIAISLHGSTPEIHRRASGQNDWQRIVDFIRNYPRTFRLPLGVNTVVSRHNLDDIGALIALCRSFPLEFLEFIPLGFSGNAVQRLGEAAVLSSAEKHRAWQQIVSARGTTRFALELDALWGPDYAHDPEAVCRFFARPLKHTYCNAGLNHFAVLLNTMRVFPCPCMAGIEELAIGELRDGELCIEEDWLAERSRIGEPCASCDQRPRCQGGCRLTAMSDHRIAHGHYERYAGFGDCLYQLGRRFGGA